MDELLDDLEMLRARWIVAGVAFRMLLGALRQDRADPDRAWIIYKHALVLAERAGV